MSIVKLVGLFEENKYDILEVWINNQNNQILYVRVISHESGVLMIVRVSSYDVWVKDLQFLPSEKIRNIREIRLFHLSEKPEFWKDSWPFLDAFPLETRQTLVMCQENTIWDISLDSCYTITNPFMDDNIMTFMYCIDLETYYNSSQRIWKKSEQDIYKIISSQVRSIRDFHSNVMVLYTESPDNKILSDMEALQQKGLLMCKKTREIFKSFRKDMTTIQQEIKYLERDEALLNFQATVEKSFKKRKYSAILEKYTQLYNHVIDKCICAEYLFFHHSLRLILMVLKITCYSTKIRHIWLEASSAAVE